MTLNKLFRLLGSSKWKGKRCNQVREFMRGGLECLLAAKPNEADGVLLLRAKMSPGRA